LLTAGIGQEKTFLRKKLVKRLVVRWFLTLVAAKKFSQVPGFWNNTKNAARNKK